MRLKYILPLLTLMLSSIAFVSCGDDVETEPVITPEQVALNEQTVGIYTGWTNLEAAMFPNGKNYPNNTINVELAEDGTLTIIYVNGTWGTATIAGINASTIKEGEGYILSGGEGSFVMKTQNGDSTQELGCNLDNATISADKNEMTAVIIANMTVMGGHGEMTFTFHTGEMPTAEE